MVGLERFNRRLRRRHPKVRMRWSPQRQLYVLEERVGKCKDVDPAEFRGAFSHDRWVQHRDGYDTIEFFRTLPSVWRLIDALEASRIPHVLAAHGIRSAAEWADRCDAEYDAKQASTDRAFATLSEAVASDAYDDMMWRSGARA